MSRIPRDGSMLSTLSWRLSQAPPRFHPSCSHEQVSRLIIICPCLCTQSRFVARAAGPVMNTGHLVQCSRCQAHSLASTSAPAPARPVTCRTRRRCARPLRRGVATCARKAEAARTEAAPERRQRGDSGLGDVLGPIGLTLGGQLRPEVRSLLLYRRAQHSAHSLHAHRSKAKTTTATARIYLHPAQA